MDATAGRAHGRNHALDRVDATTTGGYDPPVVRHLQYRLWDVFTDRPLAGNALAVFTDATGLDAATMQAVARELNLSECTFVLRPTAPEAEARIRIFTPSTELPFAGHPTLGTAFALTAPVQRETLIRIETTRAVVTVKLTRGPDDAVFGWMTQPIPDRRPFVETDELLAALGVASSGLPIELYDNGPRHVQVELASPQAVAALAPDLARLVAYGSVTFTVCARIDGARWKSRVFAPGGGIPEDPATGSAAGPLCWHLARHGRIAFGDEIVIEQGAEVGRPSILHARVFGTSKKVDRVEVGGHAVAVGTGELVLP